jgi:hypothetical protein
MVMSLYITDSNNVNTFLTKENIMCQSVRDGGRRCPIHMHQNIAAIRTASKASGLTRYQTERLFSELCREGRTAEALTEDQLESSHRRIREVAEAQGLTESVENDFATSAEHDRALDGASGYAQRLIISRAVERGSALTERFDQIADNNGLTRQEVASLFETHRDSVERVRGGDYPEEYNQNSRRRAFVANLPYDVASVVALERLNNIGSTERRRRVTTHIPVASTSLNSIGYSDGRLEVSFNNSPDNIWAYQNVPEELWQRLSTASRPGSVYARSIRSNPDYTYDSAEAAENDAYATRCASCGQFSASTGHNCPIRQRRQELADEGLSPAEINTRLNDENVVNPDSRAVLNGEEQPQEVASNNSVTSEVPAAIETEEEVAASDAEESTATENEFILAAPDVPTHNPYSHGDEHSPTDLDGHEYENFIGIEAYRGMITNQPSAEQQLMPEGYDDESRVAYRLENMRDIVVITGSTYYRLGYRGMETELTEDQKASLRDTPPNIYQIVARDEDGNLSIKGAYDSNLFTVGENPGRRTELLVKRRGTAAPVETFESLSALEAARDAETTRLRSLVTNGDAEVITATATGSRRWTFDASDSQQPRVRTGKVTEIRRALRNNKVAIVPVEVITAGYRSEQSVDDQGFEITYSSNTTISGEVAVRRNSEGAIELVSNGRSLKCDCWEYRRNYSCSHINYTERHITNVIAQQAALPIPNSEATPRNRFLTSALNNREDVALIERGENEDPYISFGSELSFSSSTEYTSDVRRRIVAPAALRNIEGEPTFEQVRQLLDHHDLTHSVRSVSVPRNAASIRAALKRTDTLLPVNVGFNREVDRNRGRYISPLVTGSVLYSKADEADETVVKGRNLKCTCPEYQEDYDCKHVRFVAEQPGMLFNSRSRTNFPEGEEAANVVFNRHNNIMSQEREVVAAMNANPELDETAARAHILMERERERIETERREQEARERRLREQEARIEAQRAERERLDRMNSDTVAASNRYRENMLERWANVDSPYSANEDAFYDDYKAALARKAAGEAPIPFRTENVTDGVCADVEGARRFGVEIEFDIASGANRSQVISKIGQELYDAGLTGQAHQAGYHSGAYSGWERWSFEADCTVAGELVSPLMKDTPEDWEQLRKVCEILERNGAKASTRTGSHVHVSTGSYGMSTAKHAELVRQVNQNEDIMYRLASDPSRGRHRGTQWCAPNSDDRHDDISPELADGHNVLSNVRGDNHGTGMNFGGASNSTYKKSHVEFRMWDGTLDPAVIQQQVIISTAMADLAERRVIENNGSKKSTEARQRMGTNKAKEAAALGTRRTHTKETFKESNGKAQEFIDSIVRRPEDRASLAALFAVTNWQNN